MPSILYSLENGQYAEEKLVPKACFDDFSNLSLCESRLTLNSARQLGQIDHDRFAEKSPTSDEAAAHPEPFSLRKMCWRAIEPFLPFLFLIFYSAFGALLLYGVEFYVLIRDGISANETVAGSFGRPSSILEDAGCIGSVGLWGAIFFVNTLHTTIGYGTIYPCCDYTKVLTVIYAIVGIPVTLIVLDKIGKACLTVAKSLCSVVRQSARKLKTCLTHSKHENANDFKYSYDSLRPDTSKSSETDDVPIWLGVLLTLSWLLVSALVYARIENWQYGDSLYFTFISVLTVGLGDIAPVRHTLTLITCALLFVGLALVATTINIIQSNIENLIGRIQAEIKTELEEALQKSADSEVEANNNDAVPKVMESPEDITKRVMDKYKNTWVFSLVPAGQVTQLTEQALEKLNVKNASAQTRLETSEIGISAVDPVNVGIITVDPGKVVPLVVPKTIDDVTPTTESPVLEETEPRVEDDMAPTYSDAEIMCNPEISEDATSTDDLRFDSPKPDTKVHNAGILASVVMLDSATSPEHLDHDDVRLFTSISSQTDDVIESEVKTATKSATLEVSVQTETEPQSFRSLVEAVVEKARDTKCDQETQANLRGTVRTVGVQFPRPRR